MKVAFSAQGNEITSLIEPLFGKAVCLIIYDTSDGCWEIMDTANAFPHLSGAEDQIARTLIDRGVRIVVTGECESRAGRMLKNAGIHIKEANEGSISSLIDVVMEKHAGAVDLI